ncbi:MAG: aminotransferase class I/II-fold pyridoxal phosphate-dependent enzyme [Flammeovirgaceae bacterium]
MYLENWLEQKLSDRKEKGNYRELTISKNKIDFVSNDYLGLARSAEIHQRVLKELNTLPAPFNGATGSRLLAGNSELAEETEYFLSRIFESDTTLLFNSGYAANTAVLSCIPQEGDTIFYDELVHACMHDGMRLSKASRVKFNHNDLQDLETKLNCSSGKKFVAVESLYSMDGNYCPLQELVILAERFDAAIILDEAHSTGSFGKNGSGLAIEKGVAEKIPIRIYTFGKAMGAHGACVVGSHTLRNYLINFARPFIYSTAMPPHSLLAIKHAFQFLQNNIHLQKALQERINYFLIRSKKLSYQKIESTSAIQSVMLPGNKEVMTLACCLDSVGIDCKGIRSPTVKAGTERLRICLHSFNTETEINTLVEALSEF